MFLLIGVLTSVAYYAIVSPMTQIRQQLPNDLHRWLRHLALEKGQTLAETIIELLTAAMKASK